MGSKIFISIISFSLISGRPETTSFDGIGFFSRSDKEALSMKEKVRLSEEDLLSMGGFLTFLGSLCLFIGT